MRLLYGYWPSLFGQDGGILASLFLLRVYGFTMNNGARVKGNPEQAR